MSKLQAEALEEGDVKAMEQVEEAPSTFQSSSSAEKAAKARSGKKASLAFDCCGNEDDVDDELMLLDDENDVTHLTFYLVKLRVIFLCFFFLRMTQSLRHCSASIYMHYWYNIGAHESLR